MDSYSEGFPFGIMDVVELLHLRIRRRQANSVYVDCPFCNDQRGKMNVNFVKNVWRCNYCGEHGGMLALYARLNNTTTSDAYWEIGEALCNDFVENRSAHYEYETMAKRSGGNSQSIGSLPTAASHPELKTVPQSEPASPREVHQTLSLLLQMLPLQPMHREHLRSPKRGLTDEQIDKLGFKSTPPPFLCRSFTERLVRQGCTVQGVPGFYQDDGGHWTMNFYRRSAGILIPAIGFDGLLKGFQIFLDVPFKQKDDPPEKRGAKYIWFSSSSKNMGITSGSPIHLVGDPSARVVYVIEGLLKADISYCLTGRTFAAIAGAGNTAPLDPLFALLAQNGTEEIIEAHDMDKYSNQMTMNGASKIYMTAQKYGMGCRRLTWNPNYKGFDDWQLAIRREKQRKEEVNKRSFKEQYMDGLCALEHLEACTEQWKRRADSEMELAEYLGLTQEEYKILLQKGIEALGELLESQRRRQKFVIYQLELDEQKSIPFAFKGLEAVKKAGYEQPPAAKYRVSWTGEIYCPADQCDEIVLKRLFAMYCEEAPKVSCGRPISVSDVVELNYFQKRSYYYVNGKGQFQQVKFSSMLAKNTST